MQYLDVTLETSLIHPDRSAFDSPSSEIVSVIHLITLCIHVDDGVGVAVQERLPLLKKCPAVLQEPRACVCRYEHRIRKIVLGIVVHGGF